MGNQFQKRAPAGIAHDNHISPGSFRLHVEQVLGKRQKVKSRFAKVPQIVCAVTRGLPKEELSPTHSWRAIQFL